MSRSGYACCKPFENLNLGETALDDAGIVRVRQPLPKLVVRRAECVEKSFAWNDRLDGVVLAVRSKPSNEGWVAVARMNGRRGREARVESQRPCVTRHGMDQIACLSEAADHTNHP